jgi:hypothetical protein
MIAAQLQMGWNNPPCCSLSATEVSAGRVAGLETEWCDAISNVEERERGQKKLSQDPTRLL